VAAEGKIYPGDSRDSFACFFLAASAASRSFMRSARAEHPRISELLFNAEALDSVTASVVDCAVEQLPRDACHCPSPRFLDR